MKESYNTASDGSCCKQLIDFAHFLIEWQKEFSMLLGHSAQALIVH
jgi:hypothetical protein